MVVAQEQRERRIAVNLGRAIQKRMTELGITYQDLSFATGISTNRLHRIAQGNRLYWLESDEIEAIASALNTTVSVLLQEAGYDLSVA